MAEPSDYLDWPPEWAAPATAEFVWHDGAANRVLDFHGSPQRARLTLLSDGNHHMALADTLQAFVRQYPEVADVFYVTLPPPLLLQLLTHRGVRLAHLRLDIDAQAFIGPKTFLDRVAKQKRLQTPHAFARSKGQALLIARGNPKHVDGIADLTREDVRLFISNPQRESASFEVYAATISALCRTAGIDPAYLTERLLAGSHNIVHGQHVHHREAPAAVAAGQADAAILYRHLALRYCRVFRDRFDMVELDPAPNRSVCTDYFVGAVDGEPWGARLAEFMSSPAANDAYDYHGLEPLSA